jgi:hypothetical protein
MPGGRKRKRFHGDLQRCGYFVLLRCGKFARAMSKKFAGAGVVRDFVNMAMQHDRFPADRLLRMAHTSACALVGRWMEREGVV